VVVATWCQVFNQKVREIVQYVTYTGKRQGMKHVNKYTTDLDRKTTLNINLRELMRMRCNKHFYVPGNIR